MFKDFENILLFIAEKTSFPVPIPKEIALAKEKKFFLKLEKRPRLQC